jgi:hypothetical protein
LNYLLSAHFEGNSHISSELDGTADIFILGIGLEREQLETMRALGLKIVAYSLRPFSKHHRAFGTYDFDLIVDHDGASK